MNYEGIFFIAVGLGWFIWKLYVELQIVKELKKWGLDKNERRRFRH